MDLTLHTVVVMLITFKLPSPVMVYIKSALHLRLHVYRFSGDFEDPLVKLSMYAVHCLW